MLDRGFVQVYTGDGKGKTTAAVGLAVRALSRGLKVCMIQFMKGDIRSGECSLLEMKFSDFTIVSTGTGSFIMDKKSDLDTKEAKRGLQIAKKAIESREYDLVILDEINVAVNFKLIEIDDVLRIIKNKPGKLELVLTGRAAPEEIINAADLVTEMKRVKHYYDKGIKARIGIEE